MTLRGEFVSPLMTRAGGERTHPHFQINPISGMSAAAVAAYPRVQQQHEIASNDFHCVRGKKRRDFSCVHSMPRYFFPLSLHSDQG